MVALRGYRNKPNQMNMSNVKSISACYEEIKQREIEELKKKVRGRGGKFAFDEDEDAPEVLCNLKYEGPADVMITSVEVCENDYLYITGRVHYHSGCGSSYGDVDSISVSDISYGGLSVICDAIPDLKDIVLADETRRFCETVGELSHLMYDKLYEKYEDTFVVLQKIIDLSIEFERRFVRGYDFLLEIEDYAKDCLAKI